MLVLSLQVDDEGNFNVDDYKHTVQLTGEKKRNKNLLSFQMFQLKLASIVDMFKSNKKLMLHQTNKCSKVNKNQMYHTC